MRKLLIGLLAALTLLAPTTALAQQQTSGGTFTLPINDDPQMWPLVGGLYNILVNKALYSTLLRYDLETLEPVGDLAESYEVSDDDLTYTFNLRDDVTWHDGEPFTADDVVFTMGLWTNPDVPFFLSNNFRLVEEVTAPDDHTVVVRLSEPQASFPTLLGYLANILPEHLLSDLSPEELTNPATFLQNPIGTGPFKFAEYQPGSHVRLVRNEDYFAGTPHLDALVYRIVPDANAQLALLQSGELDFVAIEPFQLEALERNPNIQLQSVPIVRHEYIALNNSVPALADPNVRAALTLALDREQLLETVFRGRGQVATGPFPPSMGWAYNDEIEPLPYDPEQAKALLDEAGWTVGPDGVRQKDGERLSFTILYDPANPTRARTALIAQQLWNQIGVETDFETSEYRAIVSRIRQTPPDYEVNPNYLITPPDPDGVANYYLSDSLANSWQYQNPEVDALFNEAATTTDRQERAEAYARIQEIIHEDQPNVFTVYPEEIQALSGAVESFPQAGYRDALAWAHLISKR
jgi:peptide/nickel transport system substrate-binding protein